MASQLAAALEERGHRAEVLVDDNRLADRAAAIRAGIGWQGRSTMILTPGLGPWLLLGTVVTDAPLEESAPMRRGCGTCVACLPACPTGALSEMGLDARRCLSTWLQTPGAIPHWVRPHLGRRIYGCDDCLASCPPGGPALEASQESAGVLSFEELLRQTDDELLDRFHWWYVPRRDGRHIRRNLVIAAGNSAERAALVAVRHHLGHPSGLIRGHAAWALARGSGSSDRPALVTALEAETVPEVREEITLALMLLDSPEEYRNLIEAEEWLLTHGATLGLGALWAVSSRIGRVDSLDAVASRRPPGTPAIRFLRASGIVHRTHLFDHERHSGAAGAAEALGIDPHEVVKTIVFRTNAGEGVVVLMNGDLEVSTRRLARVLGARSVEPADARSARRWTGYEFGGTSPFGMRTDLAVYAERGIERLATIYVNGGRKGLLVEMSSTDLLTAVGAELADLAT